MSVKKFKVTNADYSRDGFTIGKVYEAISDDGEGVFFANDLGVPRYIYYVDGLSSTSFEIVEEATDGAGSPTEKSDAVLHPAHYNQGGIECIAAIRASMSLEAFRGFLKGNQLKYLWRYEAKGKPAEDLAKSNQYGAWLAETYTETK